LSPLSWTRRGRALGLCSLLAAPAAVLALGLLGLVGCGRPHAESLVLITLDTVRRDHLPIYGYERNTTPFLAQLATGGAVFETAISQETNTGPSHASMLTGLYPPQHGALRNGERITTDLPTLAARLRAAGFRTGAFVSATPLKAAVCGLDRGFEVYDDDFSAERRVGSLTVRHATDWLSREVDPSERFFLFVHLYDAHGPYEPLPGYQGRFRSADPGRELPSIPHYQRITGRDGRPVTHLNRFVDRYDEGIRFVDDQVARLLRVARRRGTAVVVLSDHGEVLGERSWPLDHGATVFDEEIRIPLLIAAPGVIARRIRGTIETVDLLPTLLDLLGLPAPAGGSTMQAAKAATEDRDASDGPLPGRDLAPILRGADEHLPSPWPAFSSSRSDPERYARFRLERDRFIESVRYRRWKLIRYPGVRGPILELYDLEEDPGERHNRAHARPQLRDRLAATLDAWRASFGEAGAGPTGSGADAGPAGEESQPIPDDLRRQLESLGYVGGGNPEW